MLLGIVPNAVVGGGEGIDESDLSVVAEVILVHFSNRLHGEATGFLPAFVATHAVSDYGEATFALKFLISLRLPVEIGILVIFALAAYVGKAGYIHSGFHAHEFDRQICSLSADCFQDRAAQREATNWEILR
jgi:hypothetical protein